MDIACVVEDMWKGCIHSNSDVVSHSAAIFSVTQFHKSYGLYAIGGSDSSSKYWEVF